MAKKWITSAIQKPGALTKAAQKAGQITKQGTISNAYLQKLMKKKTVSGQRARLADTLTKLRRKAK